MSLKKPNTICKNANCNKGSDGGRKHYFTCRYCAHSENWRSVACSWDCYLEYQAQIIAARNSGNNVDLLPERTDMTLDEVKVLIHDTSTDEIISQTLIELAEEIDKYPSMGFGEIVDLINEELDHSEV